MRNVLVGTLEFDPRTFVLKCRRSTNLRNPKLIINQKAHCVSKILKLSVKEIAIVITF